jgi:hypothetical protein
MTKAEIEAAALKAKQDEANAEVDALKKAIDFDMYEEDAITTINGLYATVKAAIESATTQEEVDAAVAAFKVALAEVPQKDIDNTSSDVESTPSDNSSKEETPKKKGCSSAVSGLAYGMVALAAVAVLFKRRKED